MPKTDQSNLLDKAVIVSQKEWKIPAHRRWMDRLFGYFCFLALGIAGFMLAFLLYSICVNGIARISPKFLTSFPNTNPDMAGIKAGIYGSVYVALLTGIIAVPIGIAAALYLEEFNFKKTRLIEFVQLNIANLAGVPSIVYGLLGLALFVRWLSLGRSVISGSLTMSLLILPTIILVCQEALRAVPKGYREGSLALGATKWQTIRRQVLPAASPGILTGIILSLSRALGETAPLITIGAVTYMGFVPNKLTDQFTVLPIQIFYWSGLPVSKFHSNAAGAIIVLLAILLVMNGLAIYLRSRAQTKK